MFGAYTQVNVVKAADYTVVTWNKYSAPPYRLQGKTVRGVGSEAMDFAAATDG